MARSLDSCSLSVLLSSLPCDFELGLKQVVALGFKHVDVVGLADRPASHLEALAESGLLVSCAALGRHLPPSYTLDAPSVGHCRVALEEIKRQITDAGRLGATHCYVVPGMGSSPDGLIRFAEACRLLADYGAQRMIRLCVEPIPGRALSSALGTLEWLEQVGHDNLQMLLDVGHCLISREDPAQVIKQAGNRLGYVHLDDNDGISDLHWPLLTGRLTEAMLLSSLVALSKVGYAGVLTLELHADSADPLTALRDGKKLVERLLGQAVKVTA